MATPKAIKQGARFNIEREENIIKKRVDAEQTFEKQRQLVAAQTQMKWQEVKDEYCQDFEAEKREMRRLKVRENFRNFIKNFLEQYEIITQKLKINPMWLREYSLFPLEPFEKGEIVRTFLRLVKCGDLVQVDRLIKQDPELVFQFDEMN